MAANDSSSATISAEQTQFMLMDRTPSRKRLWVWNHQNLSLKQNELMFLLECNGARTVKFGVSDFHGSWNQDAQGIITAQFNYKGSGHTLRSLVCARTTKGWFGWDYLSRQILMKPLSVYDSVVLDNGDPAWQINDDDTDILSGFTYIG